MTNERLLPTVSFNMADEHERALYEFARGRRKYFSRYVKWLIERDRDGLSTPFTNEVNTSINVKEAEYTEESEDLLAVSAFL